MRDRIGAVDLCPGWPRCSRESASHGEANLADGRGAMRLARTDHCGPRIGIRRPRVRDIRHAFARPADPSPSPPCGMPVIAGLIEVSARHLDRRPQADCAMPLRQQRRSHARRQFVADRRTRWPTTTAGVGRTKRELCSCLPAEVGLVDGISGRQLFAVRAPPGRGH